MKTIPAWLIVVILLFALGLVYLFLKFIVPICVVTGLVLAVIYGYNRFIKDK